MPCLARPGCSGTHAPSSVTGTVEAKAELGDALAPLLPYSDDRPRNWCQCGVATTAGFAVWDTQLEDSIGTREIVLISASDRDAEFIAWSWSDGRPGLPPFAWYLMEAAKLRYHARLLNSRPHRPRSGDISRALAELGVAQATGTPHPNKMEFLRSRLSRLRTEESRLIELEAEQRRLHQEISMIRDNLREAAGPDGDQGIFAEDLAQARLLIENLDRDLGYLRQELDGAARIRSVDAEELRESQQPHMVAVNDEENAPAAEGLEEPAQGGPADHMIGHLGPVSNTDTPPTVSGNRIFIGHGRSPAWRELKDFLKDRLHLEWDEFNRVPVAVFWTGTRLSSMLDNAAMAFLICTAEDEHADSTRHARENVIHEAGLFQGRLGFARAIILLEDSCSEFSNVHGLGQIRFPRGQHLGQVRGDPQRAGARRNRPADFLTTARTRRLALLLSGIRWIVGQRTNDVCPLSAERCALSAARPAAQDTPGALSGMNAPLSLIKPSVQEQSHCLFFLPGSPPCTPGVAASRSGPAGRGQ